MVQFITNIHSRQIGTNEFIFFSSIDNLLAETTDHHFFDYLVFYLLAAEVILNLYLSFLGNHDMTYSSGAWLGLWNLGLYLNCAFDPPKIIVEQILCHLLTDYRKIILLLISGKNQLFEEVDSWKIKLSVPVKSKQSNQFNNG